MLQYFLVEDLLISFPYVLYMSRASHVTTSSTFRSSVLPACLLCAASLLSCLSCSLYIIRLFVTFTGSHLLRIVQYSIPLPHGSNLGSRTVDQHTIESTVKSSKAALRVHRSVLRICVSRFGRQYSLEKAQWEETNSTLEQSIVSTSLRRTITHRPIAMSPQLIR